MALPTQFIERMKSLLGNQAQQYFDSLKNPPVRAVTLCKDKIPAELFEKIQGDRVSRLGFCDYAYKISDDWKVGSSPEHHGGAVYVQEPGAMLPVLSAPALEGAKALDLCASPGGKTVQTSLLMGENGTLVSNEIDKKRAVTLAGNVQRMGLKNTIVTNYSARELTAFYDNYFDFIVVDAPCSGEGMFRKNPQAENEWSEAVVLGCAQRQKEIIKDAFNMLAGGGIMVYSTCTFAVEENEQNVYYAVNELGMELVAPNERVLPYSSSGVDYNGLNGEYMRRVYPHNGVGEGQFFAVLRKAGEQKGKIKINSSPKKKCDVFEKFAKENLTSVPEYVVLGDSVISPTAPYPDKLRPLLRGVKLGDLVNGRFVPHHNLYSAYYGLIKNRLDVDEATAEKYLRGEEIECAFNGYHCVFYQGIPLGGGKASNGALKNHYPKGLRNQ